jgi:hypothetical protein
MIGGKRAGSGRKRGVSKVTLIKRKFQDYITEEEVKKLVDGVKKRAKKDPQLAKFVLEQIFGKAPQRMEVTGEGGEPIKVTWE